MTKRSILVVVATLNRDTITITINITITCSSILVVVAALNKDICLLSSSRSPTVRFLSHETPTVSKQLITVKTHTWWKISGPLPSFAMLWKCSELFRSCDVW